MKETTTITLRFRTAGYANESFGFIRRMLRVIQENGGALLMFPDGSDSVTARYRRLHTEYRRRGNVPGETDVDKSPAVLKQDGTVVRLENCEELQEKFEFSGFDPQSEGNCHREFFVQLCFMLTLRPPEYGPDTHDFTGECRWTCLRDEQTTRVTHAGNLLSFERSKTELIQHELKKSETVWTWEDRKGYGGYPETPRITRNVF